MTTTKIIHRLMLATILTASTLTVFANAESEQRTEKRRGPPPEAIEVCAGLTEGAACSFTGRRGEVAGTCFAPPKNEAELVCAPEGGPPKRHQKK